VNSTGVLEHGIDQGGLFKEFVTEVLTQGFNPNRSGLFMPSPRNTLYPNPKSHLVDGNHLLIFEFLGRFLAKAIYDGVVVDAPLAGFFLSKLTGRYNFFDELASFDPVLYKNLLFLKRYDDNVEDLSLTMSLDKEDGEGNVVVFDLLPDGSNKPVTNSNRSQYIYLMADYHLNKSIERQCRAFVKGFQEVIPFEWIRIFSPSELQQVISGDASDAIDIDDMQKYAQYSGGYSSMSSTIRTFWKVVKELTMEEQKKLVKFITGYPKPPLMGFKALHPPLTIHRVENERASGFLSLFGPDTDRLPTASVCFNLLKLPEYRKSSTLKEKLKYSILSGAGFELS